MPIPSRNPIGQALSEFCAICALIGALLYGLCLLFQCQWDRLKCGYQVFEATHAALMREVSFGYRNVRLTENEETWSGELHCSKSKENISFRKLEAISW